MQCFSTFLIKFFFRKSSESRKYEVECPQKSNSLNIEQWYFVTKIVLTYCEKKIVLVIKEKLLKFKAEGREVALEQFIQTVKA